MFCTPSIYACIIAANVVYVYCMFTFDTPWYLSLSVNAICIFIHYCCILEDPPIAYITPHLDELDLISYHHKLRPYTTDLKSDGVDRFIAVSLSQLNEHYLDEKNPTLIEDDRGNINKWFRLNLLGGIQRKQHIVIGHFQVPHNKYLFEPSLRDVIHLVHSVIPIDELQIIDRIYVTTTPYPKSSVNDCYVASSNKHIGKTVIDVVYQRYENSNKYLSRE